MRVVAGDRSAGRLYTKAPGMYVGERRTADGKTVTRRIRAKNNREAIPAWELWKAAEEKREEEHAARAEQPAPKERESTMATAKKTRTDEVWNVLTVNGGKPVALFDNPDKALTVMEALMKAAEASGFDADYDIAEVTVWAE